MNELETYAGGRTGVYDLNEDLVSSPATPVNNPANLRFEITDHLGSVRAMVSGVKDATTGNAVIIALTDYHEFGMAMRLRSFANYRYGYQGSEKESGVAGMYTTDFRMLDVRIGKWFIPDPVTHFSMSPYASMDNNPIYYNDQFGLETGDKPAPGDMNDKGQLYGYNGTTCEYGWNNPLASVDITLEISCAVEYSAAGSAGTIGDPALILLQGLDQIHVINEFVEEGLKDKSKLKAVSSSFNLVVSGLQLVKAMQNIANHPEEPKISDVPFDFHPILAAANLLLMKADVDLQQDDDFNVKAQGGDFSKFRDWANKVNAERSAAAPNTIIVIYTSVQLGKNPNDEKFTIQASPSTIVGSDKNTISETYKMNAVYVYWGHLSDYNVQQGRFTPNSDPIEIK